MGLRIIKLLNVKFTDIIGIGLAIQNNQINPGIRIR